MTKNVANTLDTFTDTMKAAARWGDNLLKLVDGITAETSSKAMKALETGGDFAKESKKAVWEMKAVSGADGIRLKTSVDESVSFFKQGFAGTDGVAKSVRKSGIDSDELIHVYRGTDKYAEISAFKETGHLMSDATRNIYMETGNLYTYLQSGVVHDSWLKIWGNEMDYVQAHGAFGTELSQAFGLDRTLMSVTTDPDVVRRFVGDKGRVFEAYIPRS